MKRKSKSVPVKTEEREANLMPQEPVSYPIAETSVTALQIFHNPERKPTEEGPWSDEADKVAWVDEETGLGCIILRQENGTLSGYVGVGTDHPLFGFESSAVPVGISNTVHGAITYGKACEVNRFAQQEHGEPRTERYTVCHVRMTRTVRNYRTVQTTKDEFEHEDLWWLGFDTDHPGDLVPKPGWKNKTKKSDVYRDQAYVYAQCIALARRLKGLVAEPHDENHSSSQLLLPQGEAKNGNR